MAVSDGENIAIGTNEEISNKFESETPQCRSRPIDKGIVILLQWT
jgi:hypothetical protein